MAQKSGHRLNILARGLLYLARKAAGQSSAPLTPTSAELMRFFGNVSASGKAVTEESVMGISAAWSCMRILSETIGSIPWAIYREDGSGNASKAEGHELSAVLVDSPNADMTSTEFREAKVLNLCQAGNAYSWIERADGGVTSLQPMKSGVVAPMRKAGGNTKLNIPEGAVFYRIQDRGLPFDAPREKVWHVKGFGSDGLVGLSPIGAAREAMGMALATEEFGAKFFSQGGLPSGIVSVPNWLKDDQREIARQNMQQMLGGLGNAHKFALFEGGMKPEPWGDVPLEDMQFLLLRKFSVAEICRFYRVPPHMVADLDKATFSNIEHLSQEFVMYTLMPYFTRFEASVSKWLMRPKDRGKFFLRFNFEGLLRADSKGRAEFYASALQNGWMNRNEVRAKENANRVEGLDEYTVQSNMIPVDELDAVVASMRNNKPSAPKRLRRDGIPTVLVVNQQPIESVAPPASTPSIVNVRTEAPQIELQMPSEFHGALGAMTGEVRLAISASMEAMKGAAAEIAERTQAAIGMVAAVSARVEHAAKEQAKEAARLTEAAAKRHEQASATLVAELRRPRKAVFDERGEPIGTVPVDSLH